MTSLNDTVIIPDAPEELTNPVRSQGQDFAWTKPVFADRLAPAGHKSDDDSYSRSSNLVYKRKILKQKARMK
jgi:hypothetical protein